MLRRQKTARNYENIVKKEALILESHVGKRKPRVAQDSEVLSFVSMVSWGVGELKQVKTKGKTRDFSLCMNTLIFSVKQHTSISNGQLPDPPPCPRCGRCGAPSLPPTP